MLNIRYVGKHFETDSVFPYNDYTLCKRNKDGTYDAISYIKVNSGSKREFNTQLLSVNGNFNNGTYWLKLDNSDMSDILVSYQMFSNTTSVTPRITSNDLVEMTVEQQDVAAAVMTSPNTLSSAVGRVLKKQTVIFPDITEDGTYFIKAEPMDYYGDYEIIYSKDIKTDENIIILYENSSETNRIDKTTYLKNTKYFFDCTFKTSVSVSKPIITLQADDIINYNYCYIPQLKRYYFVDDYVSVREGVWDIYLRCDVLMSFKNNIKELECIISRQEFYYNKLIPDDKRPIQINYDYDIIGQVDTGFDFFNEDDTQKLTTYASATQYNKDFRYVVTMVGNNFNKTGRYSPFLSDFATPIIVDTKILSKMLDEILAGDWKIDIEYLYNNPSDGFIKIMYYPFSVINKLIDINGSWEISKDKLEQGRIWRWHNDEYYDLKTQVRGELGTDIIKSPLYYNPMSGFQLGATKRVFQQRIDNVMFDLFGFTPSVWSNKAVEDSYQDKIAGILKFEKELKFEKFSEFWNYQPYSEYLLYIPFYGFTELDMTKFENTIKVKYVINLLDGKTTIEISNDYSIVLYLKTYVGIEVPLGRTTQAESSRNILLNNISTGAKLLTGGMIDTKITGNKEVTKINRGKSDKVTSFSKTSTPQISNEFSVSKMANILLDGTINHITASTVHMNGGTIDTSANNIYLSTNIMLFAKSPKIIEITNYAHLFGIPSNKKGKLKDLTGYTEVGAVHMDGFPNTTEPELDEIENLLKSGVIL